MLGNLAKTIEQKNKIKYNQILVELQQVFNRDGIYNIYELIDYFNKKYEFNKEEEKKKIEQIILNGKKYVYEDAEDFLRSIKEKGHIINLLTNIVQNNQDAQLLKIKGSGLSYYFDNIIIAMQPKYKLDLNYKNGIFIDDNPKDIRGLYSRNPMQIMRIRRIDNKYSKEDLEIPEIKEYRNLKEVKI
jgi:FMN phosphatase YigB (HAD superfamily)